MSYNKLSQRKYQHSPKGKYANCKRKAKQRGIPWEITFDEWWNLWQESGKWDLRGSHGESYLMCRTRDSGPYKIGNVRIDTWRSNVAERAMLQRERSCRDF